VSFHGCVKREVRRERDRGSLASVTVERDARVSPRLVRWR
jgi:hypothetical protein